MYLIVVMLVYIRLSFSLHTPCQSTTFLVFLLFSLVLFYKHLLSFEQSHISFCQFKICVRKLRTMFLKYSVCFLVTYLKESCSWKVTDFANLKTCGNGATKVKAGSVKLKRKLLWYFSQYILTWEEEGCKIIPL